MFDPENLVALGLGNQLISVWQVFPYLAIVIVTLLLQRVKLCLLVTYLFTYYLGFITYWGDHITSAGSMLPFFVYTFCGLAIIVLYALASFWEVPAGAKSASRL